MAEESAAPAGGRDGSVAVRGIRLHVKDWPGVDGEAPFVLVHGLASNLLTWVGVAELLSLAGHRVVAVDQRGHGLSDKPDTGYGFDQVTADLGELVGALGFRQRPIVAGQSWGAAVVLDLAARYPGLASGIVLVDGGFGDLSGRPGATWERVSVDLRPPLLAGTPRVEMVERMRRFHPDWTDSGIDRTLGNFEVLPDGTVRPWLTLDRHMQILRAMWEHHSSEQYARVEEPVLLCPAARGDPARIAMKREGVERASASLRRARVHWFEDTDHDVHVHRPNELARVILEAVGDGFFG
jgi:pimeloyl-ACP methyl ester carboxylesterase